MHESWLKAWEAYYLIVGTAAGALTGLQFVVMTLIAEAGRADARKDSLSAFGSPNIVHFCAALLASSILSAPWPSLRPAGWTVAGCGVLGILYSAVVLRRALRQGVYQPVAEDWVWHIVLPAAAYTALFLAGIRLDSYPLETLFAIGAAVLLLIFIGIHNAWDTVMYVTVEHAESRERANTGGAESEHAVATPPDFEPARGPLPSPPPDGV